MARNESDREDLMQEATALVERGEFRIARMLHTVIAGYRRDGSLSLYFGADPCIHFDPQRRLRRAFVDGDLYRTQGETMARLTRVRASDRIELRRRDLTANELDGLMQSISVHLERLHHELNHAECVSALPDESTVRSRLAESLCSLTSRSLNLAPAIRGKR